VSLLSALHLFHVTANIPFPYFAAHSPTDLCTHAPSPRGFALTLLYWMVCGCYVLNLCGFFLFRRPCIFIVVSYLLCFYRCFFAAYIVFSYLLCFYRLFLCLFDLVCFYRLLISYLCFGCRSWFQQSNLTLLEILLFTYDVVCREQAHQIKSFEFFL